MNCFGLGPGIVGYLIPVWVLAIVCSGLLKSLSWGIFILTGAFYSIVEI